MPLVFCQLIMLPIALGAADGLWPGRFAALSTAATVGLGAASAYAIFTAGDWAHWGQGLFWSLAGAYGGIAFEAATGFWSWTRERLERTGGGACSYGLRSWVVPPEF
ncbi:hypothetical protein LZ32DRAFT_608289 [Colletotrichum eremochloae]|nr:hypothetical protein LZ32DRAFT_608289 [Colletotrichum eremochloae]